MMVSGEDKQVASDAVEDAVDTSISESIELSAKENGGLENGFSQEGEGDVEPCGEKRESKREDSDNSNDDPPSVAEATSNATPIVRDPLSGKMTAAQRRSMRLLRQQSGGGPPPSSKGDGSKRPMLGATKGQGDVRSQRLQKHCAMMDVWGKKKGSGKAPEPKYNKIEKSEAFTHGLDAAILQWRAQHATEDIPFPLICRDIAQELRTMVESVLKEHLDSFMIEIEEEVPDEEAIARDGAQLKGNAESIVEKPAKDTQLEVKEEEVEKQKVCEHEAAAKEDNAEMEVDDNSSHRQSCSEPTRSNVSAAETPVEEDGEAGEDCSALEESGEGDTKKRKKGRKRSTPSVDGEEAEGERKKKVRSRPRDLDKESKRGKDKSRSKPKDLDKDSAKAKAKGERKRRTEKGVDDGRTKNNEKEKVEKSTRTKKEKRDRSVPKERKRRVKEGKKKDAEEKAVDMAKRRRPKKRGEDDASDDESLKDSVVREANEKVESMQSEPSSDGGATTVCSEEEVRSLVGSGNPPDSPTEDQPVGINVDSNEDFSEDLKSNDGSGRSLSRGRSRRRQLDSRAEASPSQSKEHVETTSEKPVDKKSLAESRAAAWGAKNPGKAADGPKGEGETGLDRRRAMLKRNPHALGRLKGPSANDAPPPIPTKKVKRICVDGDRLVEVVRKQIEEKWPKVDDTDTVAPRRHSFDFDCHAISVVGPRVANEDEFTVIEDVGAMLGLDSLRERVSYFGVFDGHSGHHAAVYTRIHLHKIIADRVTDFDVDLDDAIFHGFKQADDTVNAFQAKMGFTCGTTCVTVWKIGKKLVVGNVGDCQGFLRRGGQPVPILDPHRPNRDDEKDRVKAAGGAVVWFGAWRVNGVLAVSRSIGDSHLKHLVIAEPDITRFEIQDDDEFMVVASDGLWDTLSYEEAMEFAVKHLEENDRKSLPAALCEESLQRGSKDNVTCIVVFFK